MRQNHLHLFSSLLPSCRSLVALAAMAVCAVTATARVYYVKVDGTGDGSTWEQATSSIQAAINAAQAGDEVWIAKGTYRPDSLINSTRPDCATSHAFFLKDGVSLYGGFVGNETSTAQRNAYTLLDAVNGTILCADDDVPDVWVRQIADGTSYRYTWQFANDSLEVVGTHGNSTHLLYGTTTFTHPTRIDGLVLKGANANIWRVKAAGAALYAMGNIQVSNCHFIENSSYFAAQSMTDSNTYGGAVFLYCDNGEASITDCLFERNYAHSAYGSGLGGAVYGRRVTISGCYFIDCVADDGGAVYNNGGTIEYCTFLGCYASGGGALFNNGMASGLTVTNCRGLLGGGIYNYAGRVLNAQVANCYADAPEYGSTMGGRGGGIYLQSGDAVNVAVYNNTAFQGGGIFVVDGKVVNATVQRNQIRANQDADTANIGFHNPELRDGLDAEHVFNSVYLGEELNECFVQPTTWRGVATTHTDSIAVTRAYWMPRSYTRLMDKGTVAPGYEDITTDLEGNKRIVGDAIDIGAYECNMIIEHLGDVDHNGRVDIDDVNLVINIILDKADADDYHGRADVNNDGSVDINDMNLVINIILH